MARLPQPGGDNGNWGNILNEYLAVEHNTDGTLKLRSDGTLDNKANKGLVFDARDYGAVLNGVADDTAAIQAAINAAAATGGGTVQLPSGTAVVSTIVLKHKVWLRGAGLYSTTLYLKSGTNAPVIKNYVSSNGTEANAEFCGIIDLKIDGNRTNNANTGAHGIHFLTNPLYSKASGDEWFDTHHLVQNVMIVFCGGKGFLGEGRSETRLINVYVEKCNAGGIEPAFDSYLQSCSVGACNVFGFSFTRGNIMANNCKAFISGTNHSADVPGFYLAGLGKGTTLTGCIAQNNNGAGFFLENASGFILAGCVADSNNYGVGNADADYAGVEISNSTNCVVDVVSTQGYQNGVQIGNQKHALRLTGGANFNDIRVVTYAQSPFVLGTTLTPDSSMLLNRIAENGAVSATGDYLSMVREGVLSQNGARLRFYKKGNNVDAAGGAINGTELGGMDFYGWDAATNAYSTSAHAKMLAAASQTWSSTARGTSITFQTTQNDTTSVANALRLNHNKQAIFYGDILPTSNNTLRSGTSSNYWSEVYGTRHYFNSTAYLDGASAGVIAVSDATNISLGTTTGTKIGTSTSQKLGFYNSTPVVKPTVTGSRGGNAALQSLLTQLAALGLITDSTSA